MTRPAAKKKTSAQLDAREANRAPIPRSDDGTPHAEIMDISPELAESWLGRNCHNRPIRQRAVDELVHAIKRGEWLLNGDAIRFDKRGDLADGQHRLWAIYLSEQTCPSLVITGIEPEAQETMDTGKRRNLKDTLSLRGVSNPLQVAAAVTYLWKYQNGNLRNASSKPTIQQAVAFLEQNPGIVAANKAASRVVVRFRGSQAMWASIIYTLESIDSDDAGVFIEKLVGGVGLQEGDPILVLRRRLESQATLSVGARASSLVTHALTIKAWNAYREGRQIEALSWKAGGNNPEAFPEPK